MPADPTTAVHLIQRVANQDREAFSQLYDRFSTLVFTLAMRMLRVRSDAEDLLQEVFVQVWRQAQGYSAERGSPEAWIINIARSRAIDKIRSIRRMEKSFVLTDDPARAESGENVESSAAESETRLTMNSALANLPETQRKVLELAYFRRNDADRNRRALGGAFRYSKDQDARLAFSVFGRSSVLR